MTNTHHRNVGLLRLNINMGVQFKEELWVRSTKIVLLTLLIVALVNQQVCSFVYLTDCE